MIEHIPPKRAPVTQKDSGGHYVSWVSSQRGASGQWVYLDDSTTSSKPQVKTQLKGITLLILEKI
jgi:hypothetical protein